MWKCVKDRKNGLNGEQKWIKRWYLHNQLYKMTKIHKNTLKKQKNWSKAQKMGETCEKGD